MATTRLQSGQIQIRQVQGSPVDRVVDRPVDYMTTARQEASGSQAYAQALDRMANSVNLVAGQMRQEEGIQYVIDNPPTEAQMLAAREGDVTNLVPKGNFSYFDQAVRKAQSFQFSQAFEREGRNFIVDIASKVASGQIDPDTAKQNITQMISGYKKSIAKANGEAALKFEASMTAEGHVVYKQALDAYSKKNNEKELIAFRADADNMLKIYELYARNQPDLAPMYADVFSKNLLDGAALHGPIVFKEFQDRLNKELPAARQNVLLEQLSQDEYLSNPRNTIQQLQIGIIGDANFSKLATWMKVNDSDTFRDTIKKFAAMAQERKQLIELSYVDSARQGDNIERQIYGSTNIKEMQTLFNQMKDLPINPEKIKAARNWIAEQSKPGDQETNYVVLAEANKKARAGLLKPEEIARLPLSKSDKASLAKEIGNTNNDIAYGSKLIRSSGNMLSDNLPPQFDSAEGRKMATETIAQQEAALLRFSNTPNSKGLLPTPAEIRAEGERLANGVKPLMSRAFNIEANKQKDVAVLALPQLQGVDLTNDAAVEAAIAKAVTSKRSQTDISMARDAIKKHKEALKSFAGGPK